MDEKLCVSGEEGGMPWLGCCVLFGEWAKDWGGGF
jgi:hypothetical protein